MPDELIEAELDLYHLCYDQYKHELGETDTLYQRAGFLIAALPVLGAVAYALARSDLVRPMFTRVDYFLHVSVSGLSWLGIATSTGYMVASVLMRSYEALAPMSEWHKWLQDYRSYLQSQGKSEESVVLRTNLIRSLIPRLGDAHEKAARNNERRRKLYKRAIKAMAVSLIFIAFQALLFLVLKLQGL